MTETAGVDERVTDAELVAAYRRDRERFTAVHERYFRAVYRYAAVRLNAQAAEDIAAETFLIAFDRRDRFDPERGGLRPWLLGIATNLVSRHRRKEARHFRALARVGPEPDAEGPENRVLSSVNAQRMRPDLAAALAGLSRGERDVVLLVALGGLSYGEVAKALGISPGTVGSRLNRARSRLHHVLDQEALDG